MIQGDETQKELNSTVLYNPDWHKGVIGIVASGEEAIELTATEKPDLVLMDITLEGEMDGVEAAWKIRDDFGIPVIFVTAHGDKAIYESAKTGLPEKIK